MAIISVVLHVVLCGKHNFVDIIGNFLIKSRTLGKLQSKQIGIVVQLFQIFFLRRSGRTEEFVFIFLRLDHVKTAVVAFQKSDQSFPQPR